MRYKWLGIISALGLVYLSSGLALGGLAQAFSVPKGLSINETPPVVPHSHNLGNVSPSTPVTLSLYLESKNRAGLKTFVKEVSTKGSPLYHKHLTHAEMMARFGPPSTALSTAEGYLKSQGLTPVLGHSHMVLHVATTANVANRLFDTSLVKYRFHGHQFMAPSQPITLPSQLNSVAYVGGLDTLHLQVNHLQTAPGVFRKGSTLTPNQKEWQWFESKIASRQPTARKPIPKPVPAFRTESAINSGQTNAIMWSALPHVMNSVGTTVQASATVVDSNGNPVPSARVELTQSKSIMGSFAGASNAVISSPSATGSAGANVEGTTNSSGQVTFSITDNSNQNISLSAGLLNSSGGIYATTGAITLVWYQSGVTVTVPTNTAPTGQNIYLHASAVINSHPIAGAYVNLMPANAQSGLTTAFGGRYGYAPTTNGEGSATAWMLSNEAYSGPINAVVETSSGQTYTGASPDVSWSGPTVVEMNRIPNSNFMTGGATPSQVNTANDAAQLSSSPSTSKATIGLYAQSTYTASDIATYFQAYGIKPPTINVIPVDQTSQYPISDSMGWHGELELDLERAGSSAPGATIDVYTLAANNPNADPVDTLLTAVQQDQVSVMSFSMSMPEDLLPASYIQLWDQTFQMGIAEGMAFVAASGDGGAYEDWQDPSTPAVAFPASDPYVTAVGGTQDGINASTDILNSANAWSPNGSWNGLPASSGGGYSAYFPVPSYQAAVNTNAMRGVPDIAFMTTFPWYMTYNSNFGGWGGVGGTSASAPTWAGYYADLVAKMGPLGNANTWLYGLYAQQPSLFTQAASGNNQLYHVHPGWNPVTGLGMVNVDQLVNSTQSVITSVSPTSVAPSQTVTINGNGFGNSQGSGYVTFSDNGVNWGAPGDMATFKVDSWSNSQITFTVPTPSGANGEWAVTPGTTATIKVTNSSGTTSNSMSTAINSVSIGSLTPPNAAAGQQVTIKGMGFGSSQGDGYVTFSDNGVNWGAPGDMATFKVDSWSNSQITFTVPTPSGANGQWAVMPGTTATIQVVTNGGESSNVESLPISVFGITSISPSSASAGTKVTVSGADFGLTQGNGRLLFSDNGVNWGGSGDLASFTIDSWNNTAITFTVPNPSGPNGEWAVKPGTTATVRVINNNGAVSNRVNLSIS